MCCFPPGSDLALPETNGKTPVQALGNSVKGLAQVNGTGLHSTLRFMSFASFCVAAWPLKTQQHGKNWNNSYNATHYSLAGVPKSNRPSNCLWGYGQQSLPFRPLSNKFSSLGWLKLGDCFHRRRWRRSRGCCNHWHTPRSTPTRLWPSEAEKFWTFPKNCRPFGASV